MRWQAAARRNDLTHSMWSEASQQLTQIVQDWENDSDGGPTLLRQQQHRHAPDAVP